MARLTVLVLVTLTFSLFISSCGVRQPDIAITADSVPAGTMINKGEARLALTGTPLTVGQKLPAVNLVDARTLATVNLNNYRGKVLLLSIIPSLDTTICELQTHSLGDAEGKLPTEIVRFTVSRDTPFAQQRFARETKLTDIEYLSDYKTGAFGRATGLLIRDSMLLARAIIIADQQGIVRYIQVVPEISNLPDMAKAFAKAIELVILAKR